KITAEFAAADAQAAGEYLTGVLKNWYGVREAIADRFAPAQLKTIPGAIELGKAPTQLGDVTRQGIFQLHGDTAEFDFFPTAEIPLPRVEIDVPSSNIKTTAELPSRAVPRRTADGFKFVVRGEDLFVRIYRGVTLTPSSWFGLGKAP